MSRIDTHACRNTDSQIRLQFTCSPLALVLHHRRPRFSTGTRPVKEIENLK